MANNVIEAPPEHQQKQLIKQWWNDPVTFYEDSLEVKPNEQGKGGLDDHQKAFLRAIPKYKKIAVFSGHAQGKDFIAGGLPLWFLSIFDPAIVILTAPTDRQVENVMWGEFSKHYERGGGANAFSGRVITKKWSISKDRYCIAFTTTDTKGVGKMQSFHSPNILIIASEAQGIHDAIYEQLDGIMTSDNSRLILLGNPLLSVGHYARAWRGNEYHKIVMSCLDSTNYKTGKEIFPGVASRTWVEKMRDKHGETSPVFQSRVLGIVPDEGINNVISNKLAYSRINTPTYRIYATKRRILAIDPAGEGDDACIFYVMEDGKIIHQVTLGYTTAPIIQQTAFNLVMEWKCHAVGGDKIGEGSGALENLALALEPFNIRVYYYKGSYRKEEHLSKPDDYYNLRAESMIEARDALKANHAAFNDDQELIEEATAHVYFFNRATGKMQIIDKDEVKEMLGRSPNKWDCFFIGIWTFKQLGDITNKSEIRWNLLESARRRKHLAGPWGNVYDEDDDDDDGDYGAGGI